METETKRTRDRSRFVFMLPGQAPVVLNPEQLQQLVQQAYDDHGVLAVPSYEAEAESYTVELRRRGHFGGAA